MKQIIMPDLKHNKEFNDCYQTEIRRINEETLSIYRAYLLTNEEYKAHCRRMAHVEALRKTFWENPSI